MQLNLFEAERAQTYAVADCEVQFSRRARRLSLKVAPGGKPVLVCPLGTPSNELEAFVAAHSQWLQRALSWAQCHPLPPWSRPTAIHLLAQNRKFRVLYEHSPAPRLSLACDHASTIIVRGPVDDREQLCRALQRWLQCEAKSYLIPLAERLASAAGIVLQRVQIRGQKTRWASFSEDHKLSLNRSLLLVSPRLVRYVIHHELAHSYSLDHSPRFWQALSRLEPNCRDLDRALDRFQLPAWVQS